MAAPTWRPYGGEERGGDGRSGPTEGTPSPASSTGRVQGRDRGGRQRCFQGACVDEALPAQPRNKGADQIGSVCQSSRALHRKEQVLHTTHLMECSSISGGRFSTPDPEQSSPCKTDLSILLPAMLSAREIAEKRVKRPPGRTGPPQVKSSTADSL